MFLDFIQSWINFRELSVNLSNDRTSIFSIATERVLLVILSFNYGFYDFAATSFHNFLLIFA